MEDLEVAADHFLAMEEKEERNDPKKAAEGQFRLPRFAFDEKIKTTEQSSGERSEKEDEKNLLPTEKGAQHGREFHIAEPQPLALAQFLIAEG